MIYSNQYWNDVDKVINCIPTPQRLKEKSVLITGATGMICSSVVEILLQLNKKGIGIKLYLAGRDKEKLMERFPHFVEGQDYLFIKYDATVDRPLGVNPDYIIHGASNANPEVYKNHPVETMLGNFIGLNSLLKLAVKKKARRVLYISSSEIYGNKSGNTDYKETDYGFVDILKSRSCYPSAKRAAETLCISYSTEYKIETIIVRPGHIYGPTITREDKRASAQFTWNAIDDENIIMKSTGSQVRSYCYTLDCASAILVALLEGKNGEAYNVSNRNSVVSIRQLAEAFSSYSGTKIIFENPSSSEKNGYNLMSNSSLDAEKIEKLGWRACFNLEEGVQRTIDYLRQ